MQRFLKDIGALKAFRCVCGFDGFVDEIVHTVDIRENAETYSRILTLKDYGRRIMSASGLSLNVEIVPIQRKLGGNGPIFANALKLYGADITYIGSVGKDAVDPVFADFADGIRIIGVADPAQTDAMEFLDGKIIASKLSSLNEVTWRTILDKVSAKELASFMDEADVISFNNWTMLPYMNEIFRGLLDEVLPKMKSDVSGKVLFFDLADPEKRTRADKTEAMELIQRFDSFGFRTVLGLNKKEACGIAELYGERIEDHLNYSLEALTRFLGDRMKIDCIVVHPVDRAACITDGEYAEVSGPYCMNPKLTTGAGDNFNAGFVYGYAQGFPASSCLRLGVAGSGFYVRNGRSAMAGEIAVFYDQWMNGQIDERG